MSLNESIVKDAALEWFEELSYAVGHGPHLAPGEPMSEQNSFLLYTAPDRAVKVDVFLKEETVWLTQKALAELFGVKVPAINKRLKNIFESGELVEASAISILETTASDGKN